MCQKDPENDFVCGIPIMNPIDSRLQELRTASEVIVRGTGHQPCINVSALGSLVRVTCVGRLRNRIFIQLQGSRTHA